MITYTLAKKKEEFIGILDLQRKNYKSCLSPEEMIDQGFLSLVSELPTLEEISGKFGHVIAKDNEQVIGYALVMLKEFKDLVPVLLPMFEHFDKLKYKDKALSEVSFFLMGQICIDKNYRGVGIFKGLYQKLKEQMSREFEIVITEVATRNIRSMNAHQAVGFQSLNKYVSPETEEWAIVYWDWL
jgi:hypothetical protein